MMRQDRRRLLDDYLPEFMDELHLESVTEHMILQKVFSSTVTESIDAQRNDREKRRELVRAVQKRGDVAYDAFFKALRETGHGSLAQILEPLAKVTSYYPSPPKIDESPRLNRMSRRAASELYRSSDSISPLQQQPHDFFDQPMRARSRSRVVLQRSDYFNMNYDTMNAMNSMNSMNSMNMYDERMDVSSSHSFNNSFNNSYNNSFNASFANMFAYPTRPSRRADFPSQSPARRAEFPSPARGMNFPSPAARREFASPMRCRQDFDMPYCFEEDSMNYTDAPFVQRVFDRETMYANFTNPRGLCLIINNEHFVGMSARSGTKTDKENISNLFHCMGYKIICKENLTAREIKMAWHDFAKDPLHRHASSAIIVVLSHGEENTILGSDDDKVEIHELCDMLSASKAPLLADKPKLIFIQACRGDQRDNGFPIMDHTDGIPAMMGRRRDKEDGPFFNFLGCVRPQAQPTWRKKPDQADILIAYATTHKYVSWRNSLRGSWFIQAICEVFARHSTNMDIVEMLTEVNKRVALGFQTAQGSSTLKQMPEMTSRLVKKFYFWPIRNSSV